MLIFLDMEMLINNHIRKQVFFLHILERTKSSSTTISNQSLEQCWWNSEHHKHYLLTMIYLVSKTYMVTRWWNPK